MSQRTTGFVLCYSHRALSTVGYDPKSYNHDDSLPHDMISLPFYGAEIKAFSSELRFTLHAYRTQLYSSLKTQPILCSTYAFDSVVCMLCSSPAFRCISTIEPCSTIHWPKSIPVLYVKTSSNHWETPFVRKDGDMT
jgi:hypothetical protein